MMNICGKFIEIAPLSTKISRHAKQVSTEGQRTDGLTEGRPENIMPPQPVLGGGIKYLHLTHCDDLR